MRPLSAGPFCDPLRESGEHSVGFPSDGAARVAGSVPATNWASGSLGAESTVHLRCHNLGPFCLGGRQSKPFSATSSFLAQPLCRVCVQDFVAKESKFGGFGRGFSWRIFLGTGPHKNEEKNPPTQSAKKFGGSKILRDPRIGRN